MLYIILPVHNRKETTKTFLGCLKRQTFQDFQIILIDDGSVDGTDKMVHSFYPESKIIYGDGTLWWGGSLQKSYDYLKHLNINRSDNVLIMNDDTTFGKNFLETGESILSRLNKVILKSWVIDKYSKMKCDGYIYANKKKFTFTQVSSSHLSNCTSTRGLFMNAKEFISLGGFVPEKLPHYLSDYEFTCRASKNGYKIICDDKLQLISDSKQTGFHVITYNSLFDFLKQYLSIKCPSNPKYLINFVVITADSLIVKFIQISLILVKSLMKIFLAFIFLFFSKKINVGNFYSNFKKNEQS